MFLGFVSFQVWVRLLVLILFVHLCQCETEPCGTWVGSDEPDKIQFEEGNGRCHQTSFLYFFPTICSFKEYHLHSIAFFPLFFSSFVSRIDLLYFDATF